MIAVRALLRSVWDEPAPADPPGPGWRDWVLVAVVPPAAVLEVLTRAPRWPVASAALAIGLAPLLPWRRVRPLAVTALVFTVVTAVQLILGGDPGIITMLYVLLFPYALFRWGSGRAVLLGLAVLAARVALSGDAVSGLAVLVAAGAVGGAVRFRAGAQARELDRARLLERELLAREVHDTVAHHVSGIVIAAQAGLAGGADGQAAALGAIEGEATRTLGELRTLVRALRRDEAAQWAPGPGAAELAALSGPGPGPAVDLRIDGDVAGLPAPVGAALYRLAQESVTNARRHARHASRIEVRVRAEADRVHLLVSDDGEGGGPAGPPGYGVLGMIERARLLGGSCTAGPGPERGWQVTAVLPRVPA